MSEGLLVEVCNVESPESVDDGKDTKHEKLVPQVHAKLQSLLQTTSAEGEHTYQFVCTALCNGVGKPF